MHVNETAQCCLTFRTRFLVSGVIKKAELALTRTSISWTCYVVCEAFLVSQLTYVSIGTWVKNDWILITSYTINFIGQPNFHMASASDKKSE